MKQQIEKLMLAAEVRTLAVELRNQDRAYFYKTIYLESDVTVRQIKLDQWDFGHTLDMYFIRAFVELDDIALSIDRYRFPDKLHS